jgi:hypothetical protein
MLLVTVGPAHAGLVSVQLGTQNFTDGQLVPSATFNTASAGEPAPFDQFYGADSLAGPDFSKSWTFNFAAGLTVLSASLTLGITDNDAAAPGSQVNSFTLDATNNLTTALDTAFEAPVQAVSNQYKVYTIVIPPAALGAFGDGSATFSLTLQNAVNVLNQTVHNGAGLDFSRLDLTTVDNQVATPEPSTWLLLVSGLGGLAGYRRRRRK